jgi:AraC family transcriptional regulator
MLSNGRTQVQLPGTTVELMEFRPPSPYSAAVQSDENHLVLFVPPARVEGELRCAEKGIIDYRPAMPVRFRPAGVTYEVRGLRGQSRLLRHVFSNEKMHAAMDGDHEWSGEEIERGLDLSSSRLTPLLMKMIDELSAPRLGSEIMLDALSTVVIVELVRYLRATDPTSPTGRLSHAQLRRITERVEQKVGAAPTVAELARLCDMSERNLLRLFRASTGETVSGYVRRVQLTRARQLLTMTDLPLKEISYRLGFAQPSSFIASFRRTTAETPNQFRRRLRKAHAGVC